MTNIVTIMTLCCLSTYHCPLTAQETRKDAVKHESDAEQYKKFRFGGYGEMAASYKDYDFNRFTPYGSGKKDRGEISIPRFIVAFDYKFSSKWILSTEIEFEYGGTGRRNICCSKEVKQKKCNKDWLSPGRCRTLATRCRTVMERLGRRKRTE